MAKVLVVHASRHGSTQRIAERIANVIGEQGHAVSLAAAADEPAVGGFDAVVVGSAVYMGSWLDTGIEFLRANRGVLSSRRVWLFSSGPLPGSTKQKDIPDPIENALGPAEGPGSAGRRKVEDLMREIGVRGHAVFDGAFDPSDAPKGIAERFVRLMPGSKGILPPGDYRNWAAIEEWARDVSAELPEPVPAG